MPKLRHIKQKSETELLEVLAGEFDFEINTLQPYQLRLMKGKKVLDYYPQKGRASWIDGRNKWFTIDNIEQFIETNFKDA